MSSGVELDRFLAELGARRKILQKLTEPAEEAVPTPSDLLQELHELSEQLILADEELRAQQEELEAARRTLLSMSAEHDLLLGHSSRAYAITDDRGVVQQATRGLRMLIGQPLTRVTPRPIATWFAGTDRRLIRGMIGDLRRTGETQQAGGLRLAGTGGHVVDVTAAAAVSPDEHQLRIRWELSATDAGELPTGSGDGPAAAETRGSAQLLADEARLLDSCETVDQLVRKAVEATVRLVPGARHAGLVLSSRPAGPRSVAATSELARAADQHQLQTGAGPLPTALSGTEPVVDELVSADDAGLVLDASSVVVSLPLHAAGQHLGALTTYTGEDDGLSEHALGIAAAWATVVAVALHRQQQLAGLREALESRQLIGQSVGIMIEREQVTADAAFALLARRSQDSNVKLREIARALVRDAETARRPTP